MRNHTQILSFLALILAVTLLSTGCGGAAAVAKDPVVEKTAAPTISVSASPTSITAGASSTITWTTTNATNVTVDQGIGTVAANGSKTVSPTATTTYTITATGPGGTTTASVTVTVTAAGVVPTVSISVSPTSIDAGQLSTLTWSSSNATSVVVTPTPSQEDVNVTPLSGSAAVTPPQTTTYTITATGAGGTATASATLTVVQVPPTIQFTATPTTISPGQSSKLTWSVTNATSLTIDNGVGAVAPDTGYVTVSPGATTTYTATATGPGGTQTATVTVTVTTLEIQLAATPVTITPGQSATLSYTSQNATGITIDNGIGTVAPPSGSVTVSPSVTTTYTATATDASGVTRTSSVLLTVSGGLKQNINHIIFMLQENRSFDSYFSKLGLYKQSRGFTNDIDGIIDDSTVTLNDLAGQPFHPYHYKTVCTENLSPAWNESHYDAHLDSATGTYKMDNFMQTTTSVEHVYDPNGHRAMGYYDQTDLPYYYELATQFATSDRWYSPVLANTIPNRMYMFAGTSYGTTYPDLPAPGAFDQKTIFQLLSENHISWRYYYQDDSVFLQQYSAWNTDPSLKEHVYPISDYFSVLNAPTADDFLPQVIFIERGGNDQKGSIPTDEHPDHNVQIGAAAAAQIINALMASKAWHDSAFILSYDEGGGLYDHVAPQPMPKPDDVAPMLTGKPFTIIPAQFDTTGFRVPVMVVSPWAKPHFTSHTVRDLTSILKLIETRFSLPALTRRDAAADDMTEFFDFSAPNFLMPPVLPVQPVEDPTLRCRPDLEAQ